MKYSTRATVTLEVVLDVEAASQEAAESVADHAIYSYFSCQDGFLDYGNIDEVTVEYVAVEVSEDQDDLAFVSEEPVTAIA